MESAHLIELETTFVWKMNCIQQILRTRTSNSVHLGQISKKWHVGWSILTIFHQFINQNFGYFTHIELSVVPSYHYQLVLWIRSNFDSNSSINELKNDEIKDSSSTKYRFRRFPAKTFRIFLVLLSQTFAMCDVSNQEVRSPDFTFASKQRYSEDVLKSSLCQLCKIYVISASKLFQFAGFHLVMFLKL